MKRKFTIRLLMMIVSVIFFVAIAASAATGNSVVSIGSEQDLSWLTYKALVVFIPIVASLIANFFEIKESDSRWIKVVKKLVNILALNLSQKAGK